MSTQLNSLDYSPRDFKGYGANPPNAQWPGGAKIAISIVVNYEEGSEVSTISTMPSARGAGTLTLSSSCVRLIHSSAPRRTVIR